MKLRTALKGCLIAIFATSLLAGCAKDKLPKTPSVADITLACKMAREFDATPLTDGEASALRRKVLQMYGNMILYYRERCPK